MGNKDSDKNHCYECGSEAIRYRSLLPSEPHFIDREPDGKILQARGFSGDYNVCASCYVTQWREVYPDTEVPEKILAAAGVPNG